MEDKKAIEVVENYKRYFETDKIPNIKYPHDKFFYKAEDILAHCHSMLDGIKKFISSGYKEERDRALIRLGFVQGCLASTRCCTIEELKQHNRPNAGTINSQTHEPLTNEDLQDWEY